MDASPDEDARTLARRVFSNLDALPEHDGNDMPTVRFTDSAYQDFWDWYCDTIKRADSEPSVHMEAHLAKYASLMPSIALVIELAEQASSGIPDIHTLTVSDTSSARAIAWCKYLETHARRIYGLVDDPVATARELLLKLPLMESPFSVRDVVRSNWSGLSDTKQIKRGGIGTAKRGQKVIHGQNRAFVGFVGAYPAHFDLRVSATHSTLLNIIVISRMPGL